MIISDHTRIMNAIHEAVHSVQKGILLLVHLLTKDEINILITEQTDFFIDKFHLIVSSACQEVEGAILIETADASMVYIVLPSDVHAASILAYSIHSKTQLYVNDDYPSGYLQCRINSIEFAQVGINTKVDKLISHLFYGMLSSKNLNYYYHHEDYPIDISTLRQSNISLNVIKHALLMHKIKFVYQPIIDGETGGVEYYECLLRVLDQHNEYISIGPMIQAAESKGLINIVDVTVMKMVVHELVRDKNIRLSVNISNSGILDIRLQDIMESLFEQNNVANRLIIEITETALNQDFNSTKCIIDKLHSYGCCFALDDFGSGFTSFKQLLNLPIDIIKIDGSYIRDILSNPHSQLFVTLLINLARNLGMKTVAEFVENSAVAKFLIDLRIDSMQGNFFLPASDKRIQA